MIDEEFERLAAIIQAGKGRSKLYRWLYDRHDKFAAITDGQRLDWERLTAEFVAMGLTPPVNPGSVRNTWWRVRKAYAAAQAKKAARQPPTAAPLVQPVPPLRSGPADDLPDGAPYQGDRPRQQFGTIQNPRTPRET